MAANTTGVWGPLQPWPLISVPATVLPDGNVLTFDPPKSGCSTIPLHDIHDAAPGTHQTRDHQHTQNDLVCSASIVIPESDQVLMRGGCVP